MDLQGIPVQEISLRRSSWRFKGSECFKSSTSGSLGTARTREAAIRHGHVERWGAGYATPGLTLDHISANDRLRTQPELLCYCRYITPFRTGGPVPRIRRSVPASACVHVALLARSPRTLSPPSCGPNALGEGTDDTVETLLPAIGTSYEAGVPVVPGSSDDDPWRECDRVVGADET